VIACCALLALPALASAAGGGQIAVSAGPDGALLGRLDAEGTFYAKVGLET
jgi:hypothetical protein